MKCPICGNQDPLFFVQQGKKLQCRKCLPYIQPVAPVSKLRPRQDVNPIYPYPLTPEQEDLSEELRWGPAEMYVSAICGAGKTEATFASIADTLRQGFRVGFATPRRELVREMLPRLQLAFPTMQITPVYGGHSRFLEGDIILLTTHQLARYQGKFGLLILDEYDAFPFKGNASLLGFAKASSFGRRFYLSATFPPETIVGKSVVQLQRRPHGGAMPLPELVIGTTPFLLVSLFGFLKRHQSLHHPIIVYVPTRQLAEQLGHILTRQIMNPLVLHSHSKRRQQVFRQVQNGQFSVVISTTILERGVTIDQVQVAVFEADHSVFDEATLIQIVGRVGRTMRHRYGEVLLLCKTNHPMVKKVMKEVKRQHETMLDLR